MMWYRRNAILICFVVLLSKAVPCFSQTATGGLEFGLLRQHDDVSLLESKVKDSAYKTFKIIKLSEHVELVSGGGFRFQMENFKNENFLKTGSQDNLWFLNRIMAFSHLKVKDRLEVFVELNSSTVIDKEAVSPVDKDILGINQCFVAYHFNKEIQLLLGRENLILGARRLVDLREGPNVRRSFDLAKLEIQQKQTRFTGFFAVPVQVQKGAFDNDFLDFEETFSGIYVTRMVNQKFNLDAYGFYQKDDHVTYQAGTANERRSSLGCRFFGKGALGSYNVEGVCQFGRFGNQDIRAYTFSVQGEIKSRVLGDQTVFGLKTEFISGDKHEGDGEVNTFDALYPRGAYFGRVARFGPSNLFDVHPYVQIFKSKFYVELDYDAFWRYSVADGVYNAALLLEYPDTNDHAFIAHQIGTLLGLDANNHLNFELETNYILPGMFLKESNLSASLFHLVFTTEFKF